MTTLQPKWLNRLAVFDTETTGVDVFNDRIVTASLILLEAGKIAERYDWLINPQVTIPDAAIKVHGISNQRAAADGILPEIGIAQIIAQLASALERGFTLVAYNANFDLTLLAAEAKRYSVPVNFQFEPVADPYIIDRFLDRFRRGKRQLATVAEHYGVTLDNAHDAAADSLAAGQILYALAEHYPASFSEDPYALHSAQIEWEKILTESYRDYLKTRGKAYEHITPGWPLRAE